jgi:hypothetical protein
VDRGCPATAATIRRATIGAIAARPGGSGPVASLAGSMRKLIVISHDIYVRNLLQSGAFAEIEDDETYYLAGRLRDHSEVARKPNYLGSIDYPPERDWQYLRLRELVLFSRRSQSRTQRIKLSVRPRLKRAFWKLATLPGIRQLLTRHYMRKTGRLEEIHELLQRVEPDLVIVPTGGTDPLVVDTIRSCRELGIKTLAIIYNWDNLSSKGVFPVLPDQFGVVGEQSVGHAEQIHRAPRERVTVLGSPYIDNYFHLGEESVPSPFPFRFVLFAGCYMPFDELSSLRLLERAIEEHGLDLKVVYRPHPHRQPRRRPDFFDEAEFENVVLDPQVRELYLSSFHRTPAEMSSLPMPELDYYPALLEHSEFVICPLSTMVVESAVFERRVLVIAYHDGVHSASPGIILGYDHFQGIDQIEGFELCRRLDDLPGAFLSILREPRPPRSLREQIKPWLYFDERPYSRRLAELVEELGRSAPARTP